MQEKVLPYSKLARIRVEYSNSNHNLPSDLFLKMVPGAITDSHTRDIGKNEAEFYLNAAIEIACPPLIRCYDTAFSPETGRAHVLMDDLTITHSQPDQKKAPSVRLTRLAVEALAKMHAVWWNSPRLGRDIGSQFDQKALDVFIEDLSRNVSTFIDHFGTEFSESERSIYQLMLSNADKIWGRLMRPTDLTVTHGDTHWWNFLYPNDADRDTVRIFDWNLWHIDLGARDLAFLLALGGFADPRPNLENDLLRRYHSTLVANGVSSYNFEQLFDDYRWSAARNLNIPVIFWVQGKHESTWRTALTRATESFKRLCCSELFA
jgi:hypothetical protein